MLKTGSIFILCPRTEFDWWIFFECWNFRRNLANFLNVQQELDCKKSKDSVLSPLEPTLDISVLMDTYWIITNVQCSSHININTGPSRTPLSFTEHYYHIAIIKFTASFKLKYLLSISKIHCYAGSYYTVLVWVISILVLSLYLVHAPLLSPNTSHIAVGIKRKEKYTLLSDQARDCESSVSDKNCWCWHPK